MGRANSDFRMGVEAAAKWLRGANACQELWHDPRLAKDLAARMLSDLVELDIEGTEARTVAQIVQYLRETSFGHMEEGHRKAIIRAAASIERMDWKRS